MTRGPFRGALDTPRPSAAAAMVAAATMMVALSGRLAPWALIVSGASIAFTLVVRGRPRPWQRSATVLNALLLSIASVSLGLWIEGALTIVALAHFAALAQALQLLDARPRHSEFLLVALALFQVMIAATLSDSAFFPLLLAVFALATVWTLIVHTLRLEAIEAGNAAEAQRAITSRLLGTTLVASVLTVALAVAIFPVLPRIRAGALVSKGPGVGIAMAGFSDRVELGDLGRIRLDPEVVLRVETLEGEAPSPADAYWRGLAFDTFDGRTWSITPPGRSRLPGDSEFGLALGTPRRSARLRQRILREAVDPGVVFAAGFGLHVTGPLGLLERDANRGFYAPITSGERTQYTIESEPRTHREDHLRADVAVLPHAEDTRFLALPDVSDAIQNLARSVAPRAASDAQLARALEAHLRRVGRYTDTPPPTHGRPPLEAFLEGELAGHCEYFASAMVILARVRGLPARLVNGFAGGRTNPIGDFVELTRSDAHTWVEIHYAEAGWVTYDPTPPDLRLAGAGALSARDQLAALASALELWWFRNVVDFDRGRQMQAVKKGWLAWRRWRHRIATPPGPREGYSWQPGLETPGGWAPAAGALGLALVSAVLIRRRRRRGARARLPSFYAEALALLAGVGEVRGRSTTARDFARSLEGQLPADAVDAFALLTDAYLQVRFAQRPAPEVREALGRLRQGLLRARFPGSAEAATP